MLNPYIAGSPVVEASMFFGREDVFGWIEHSLEGKFVNHILVLHGQRRVGKTSVLKQIPNFLPDKYIQVFFDLQGRTGTTLDRFLWWLASEITRTLKREHGMDLPKPDRKDFEEPEYLINGFLPGIRTKLGDDVLLLTFDEFDSLDRPEIQETLSRPLIAYLRRLIEVEGLNFIFSIGSSGDKLENMQASYTDFFKSALYRKISFLTEDDIQRLVTKPVEGLIQYEVEAVHRIGDITSGHPYFTQLMCHELFSRCQKSGARTISAEDVEAVLEDVVERGTVNLKFIWDEASDLEKWILAILAQMEGGNNQELAQALTEQHVRFSEPDLNSATLNLRDKDILRHDNRFVIHLMRLWLVANRPIDRVREELEEVNPIANRFIEIGDEYRDRGETGQAIAYYQQALNLNPGDLKAQNNIASVYLEQKDFEEAIQAFESALKIDDEDVVAKTGYCEANLALGEQARGRKDYEDAIHYYRQVLEINPNHVEAQEQTTKLQKLVSDYEGAQQAIREKRYERAVEMLQGIIVVDPTYKATTRLLTEAVESRKTIPFWRHKWILPAVGVLVLVVFGVFFGPQVWAAVSTANVNRPAATNELPISAALTSIEETSSESNATEPVISETVKVTVTPDLLADEPIPEIETDRLVYKDRFFKGGVTSNGEPITSLSWSSSGTFLGVTGIQGWVEIYDIASKTKLDDSTVGAPEQVRKATWFPGEFWITLGWGDGSIHTNDIFNRDGDLPIESIEFVMDLQKYGKILDLQYTNDGDQLAAVTDLGYLATWYLDAGSWTLIRRDQIDNGSICTIDWNPNGTSYLTVSEEKGLQTWNTDIAAVQKQLDYTSNSADWSPNGKYIAIEDHILSDGYSYLEVITPDGTSIGRSQAESIIFDVAWSPNGTLIATAGGDGHVLLWSGFENGELEPVLQISLGAPVTEVAWSPDGNMLAAGGADAYFWVWNMDAMEFSTAKMTGAPTVTPTRTLRPTPTVTPIPAWVPDFVEPMLERITNVNPDFTEDFSNPQRGWEVIVGTDESFQIEDGVARVNVKKEERSAIIQGTANSLTSRDFILEMDARIVEGEAAVELWIHFIPSDNPSDSQNVGFQAQPAESSWHVMIDSAEGRSIQQGKGNISPVGQYTHITIILAEQKVAFLLNGNPVAYLKDPYLEEPAPGLQFSCDGWSTGGICEFDNIKIWKLP
jgi:tetratricopeptide (TPR) repeat protein/WD40 repeat protein